MLMTLEDRLVLEGNEHFIPVGLLIAVVLFLAVRRNATVFATFPDLESELHSWCHGGYSSSHNYYFFSKKIIQKYPSA